MSEFLEQSVFFGVLISWFAYEIGLWLRLRTRSIICNPLLISVGLVILVLCLFSVEYKSYYKNASYLSYLLTPATISLAIPLYERVELLQKRGREIFLGILSGILSGLLSILLLAIVLRVSHVEFVTLLPKSVTTSIGIVICEELGGYVPVTAALIAVTGMIGNLVAESIFTIFHITEPIARGVALGSSSHAMGTTKAMEFGEVEGAVASLSIVISGIVTVFGVMICSRWIL